MLTSPSQFFDEQIEYAKQTLLKSGEDIDPLFVARDEKGIKHIIATQWSSEQEKHKAVMYARGYFLVHDIIEYVFMASAWLKRTAADYKYQGESIANDPDRKECLFLVHGYRKDNQIKVEGRYFTVIKEGASIQLEEAQGDKGDNLGGIFSDMLYIADDVPKKSKEDLRRMLNLLADAGLVKTEILK